MEIFKQLFSCDDGLSGNLQWTLFSSQQVCNSMPPEYQQTTMKRIDSTLNRFTMKLFEVMTTGKLSIRWSNQDYNDYI